MKTSWIDFLKLLASVVFAAAGTASVAVAQHPNILLIVTDQQHAGMMSCAGNAWVKTPNMDRLAATGVRFEKAYCTNPVCVPSRFSMFTGALPSEIGMEDNRGEKNSIPAGILENAMGNIFRRAGYETAYAGKIHLPGQPGVVGRVEPYGFERISSGKIDGRADGRDGAVDACVKFLGKKHDRPFLLVASLINPHDICYMAINDFMRQMGQPVPKGAHEPYLAAALKLPEGVTEEEFYEKLCPPLPDNFEIPEQEPEALGGFKGKRNFRTFAREKWTDKEWRLHRWAYARLTESVDAQIGRLLDSLEKAGLDKNTVVVFTSDHGDHDSAHRLEHKDTYYEEAVRVPFIISWKGKTSGGKVDRDHLISTGLDLIPTLCDFANIPIPPELRGRGARMLTEGLHASNWRDALVIEHENLRVLHLGKTKYIIYGDGANREQFVDLEKDPGEMKNMAQDPGYKDRIRGAREALKVWYSQAGLPLDPKYIVSD